ncbi:E3 ubiquitin-protein ligase TRIM71-like [Patella vulgata]|uniref:E3 ubiquitin-protein ligase TRIM71-like n=1 Tax=Patella vulgata TaxID=6465 RepID=UPI0024A94861|nr:E3 ubiquitin-protein ligase TRIM71-like [Patella vulgata]
MAIYSSKIQDNENGGRTFQCPKCSVTNTLPSGACAPYGELFPDDTFVNKLSEVISAYSTDKSCDVCDRRDVSTTAVEWCMDCYDSLCELCRDVHLHGKITSDHVVISLDEMRNLSLDAIMQRKRTVPCPQHEGELLNLYCPDCRQSLCVQCAAISHRKCNRCVTVADAMKFHEEEFEEVLVRLQALDTTHEDTPKISDAASVLEETLTASAERIKATAADLRERINQSERELLQRVEEVGAELRSKVAGAGPCSKIDQMTIIRSGGERMEALLNYGSDVEILDAFNDMKKTIAQMDFDEVDPGLDQLVRVNFNIDKTTKYFSRDFKTLGEVEVEDCQVDEGLSAWGVTCTARDEIIVADCRNKRVQKFGIEGNLIDHIQLRDEPRDLTCISRDEVAITIMNKNIFFVSTSRSMRLRRKIKTDKQYDSISISARLDNLLVSCMEDKSIDVVDLDGVILKSFNADGSGEAIFQEPRYVTFSREGNYVITDVTQNCVKCISSDGRLLFQYQPDGSHILRHPQGICIDNIGNIFIVDYSNSRIHLITCDGYFQRFVMGRESGLVRPVAIHITRSNKLIIVQSDGMVKLFTYE